MTKIKKPVFFREYTNTIAQQIYQSKIFQNVPREKIDKFLYNFEILAENIEFLNIPLFEANKRLCFSGNIEKNIKHHLDKPITLRRKKACNRILKHKEFLCKMITIELFFNKPKNPYKAKWHIINKVIPFILLSYPKKNIVSP